MHKTISTNLNMDLVVVELEGEEAEPEGLPGQEGRGEGPQEHRGGQRIRKRFAGKIKGVWGHTRIFYKDVAGLKMILFTALSRNLFY